MVAYDAHFVVIGRTVIVSEHPLTIVGVTAPEFRSSVVSWTPDVFLPLAAAPILSNWSAIRSPTAGSAVAARHDYRLWPDLETDSPQRIAVFRCSATRKENSSAINLLWQFPKNRPQTLWCGEPKIRRLQLSLLQDAKLPTGIIATWRRCSFDQRPCSLGTAAFHSEDALTGFHD